jgi:hypothetical protein
MSDQLENTVKTAGNLKSFVLLVCGIIAGAFGAGFAVRQYYLDMVAAYGTVHALQRNR